MNYQLKDFTMASQLKWRAIHLPDRLALCYLADGEHETQRLTYRELDADANKIAARLQALNLKNKPVLMLYSSGLEFVKAFFGCLYAGAIAVPTYVPKSKHLLQKIEGIQQDCGARIILTTQDLLDEGYLNDSNLSDLLFLATDDVSRQKQMEICHDTRTLPEDVVFIQYTSGSTSHPKGAIVTNKNIMVNQIMLQSVFELNEESVGVTWLPLFHDMGLIASLLNAVFVGYPIYIMPPSAFIRNPVRWLQCITKYKGTYSCAPNFAYDLCVKSITPDACANLDLSSLKKAINAAEPIQIATMEAFIKRFAPYGFKEKAFTPAYGLAEATVFVTGKSSINTKYLYVDEAALQKNKIVYPDDLQKTHRLISCGNANFLGQKIRIVNPETLLECQNEIGEIWISGEHIVRGYLNKPEATKKTFEEMIEGANYMRTGDLGFIDDEGELYITGRIKDLIIINGSNYYPQDIELTAENRNHLIRKNSIAAFSVNRDQKEQLVIVIELNKKMLHDLDADKLGSEINAAILNLNFLPSYEIVFIAPGSLPKTTSGKIQRQACKKMYLADELKVTAKWQSPAARQKQSTVASTASTVQSTSKDEIVYCIIGFLAKNLKLPIDSIRPDSTIADFSLDSIQMAEMSVALEKILNQTIPEKIFYECPTLQDMANFLIDMPRPLLKVVVDNSDIKKNTLKSRKIAIPKLAEKRLLKKINQK
jgi:acyl-CoA synthetase (AMP-forming)/AMP-acid ligase II/acyl carrier protein